MKSKFVYGILILQMVSCNQENQTSVSTYLPVIKETNGYQVTSDSVAAPISFNIKTENLKEVSCGKIISSLTNINEQPPIISNPAPVGSVHITTPGQDNFLLPQSVLVKDSAFIKGLPEIVVTKDAAMKDKNPSSFSYYGKLQGLVHAGINCAIEDSRGNLWFGTFGGAVKYDGKYFTHYLKEQGMSNDVVFCIHEDKKGTMWFGTNGGGVTKYDGKYFTHYTENEGLSNNVVFSITEDQNGNLWFGTFGGGITKYDGKSFTNYTEKEGLSSNLIYCGIVSKNGQLWFGTIGGGALMYDGESFHHFNIQSGLPNNNVLSLMEDSNGNIWFGSGAGASKYDGTNFTTYTQKDGLPNNDVFYIIEDDSKNIWFATLSGVSKFDGIKLTNYSNKEGLGNNEIRTILQDKNGNIWFGSGDGIYKYQGELFTHYTINEGLRSNTICSMLEDKKGNLWLGTFDQGVCRYDGKSFSHFEKKFGLGNNAVRAIFEDSEGNLWFGSAGGGVSKFNGQSFIRFGVENGLSNNDVRSIAQDSDGNMWFGTYGGGVCKYNDSSFTHFTEEQGLSNNIVQCIKIAKNGDLWIGTYGGGLNKYDGKYFTHFNESNGLINNDVRSIFEDEDGNIWLGTNGGGLVKMNLISGKDSSTYKLIQITKKEGLLTNSCGSFVQDKNKDLWLGTGLGLNKITKRNLNLFMQKVNSNSLVELDVFFKSYNYDDGFLGIGCNVNATCQTANGEIWWGANDRLTVVNTLAERNNVDSIAPNIQLLRVDLYNEKIPWLLLQNNKDTSFILGNGIEVADFYFDEISNWYYLPQNLSLPYNNNYITFSFIGITMSQPKLVKYQYKLEGMDDNWSMVTNRNEATYGNLPHGSYTFKVKAMNSAGFWSDELHYSFVIRPPWWKTWLFRITVSISILFLLIMFFRWRTNALRKRQKQLEKTVQLRTSELYHEKKIVEEKHKEITDSINYAERIQRSFLATKELLDKNLKDYFVLFQPKDIVSGDFYWATKLSNDKFALVTADSTGHGVPGAIMSILNITCLEKAVLEKISDPGEILNHARLNIIDRLKKDGSADGGKDGMDACLISFDFENKKLIYAAANNPIWIVRKKEVLEFVPDKMPVGKHDKQYLSFTSHQIDLEADDVIYTFTDGLPDQFGGEKGKKFMHKRLKELLISISSDSMEIQNAKLADAFLNWKGDLEQVDDVCVIGVRI